MNGHTAYYKLEQPPERIIFGDPLYFKKYAADKERLNSLVTDLKLTQAQRNKFGCVIRLSLEEKEDKMPDGETFSFMENLIRIIICQPKDYDIYLSDLKYKNHKVIEKQIGVDSAAYYLSVDGNGDEIRTDSDGFWGTESLHCTTSGKTIQAIVIDILLPEEMTEKQINRYMDYFFEKREPYAFTKKTI